MRVGVFLEDYSPEIGGGSTFQADIFNCLLELAKESRHSFEIFCRNPENIPLSLADGYLNFTAFPGSLTERVIARSGREIAAFRRRRQRENRLEQLARGKGISLMWFVGADAFQVELPYIATVWDLQHRLQPWFPEVSSGGEWERRERFYGRFLRRAAAIIVGTEAGRAEIEFFYQIPPGRIRILPHPTPGFALTPIQAEVGRLRDKYGIPEGYLFYPAQFWAHKNHAGLLHAARLLRDQYQIVVPLVFVGSDKGNKEYVRRLAAEIGLGDQVHFPGFVPQEDLASLYQNAFALSYVTFFGPENLPPLEAFAFGCPVIASAVSGAQEQLGDAALLVNPSSPEDIAGAIKSLYDRPALRQELIQKGAARARSWTGKDYVRKVFGILDEVEPFIRTWDTGAVRT